MHGLCLHTRLLWIHTEAVVANAFTLNKRPVVANALTLNTRPVVAHAFSLNTRSVVANALTLKTKHITSRHATPRQTETCLQIIISETALLSTLPQKTLPENQAQSSYTADTHKRRVRFACADLGRPNCSLFPTKSGLIIISYVEGHPAQINRPSTGKPI